MRTHHWIVLLAVACSACGGSDRSYVNGGASGSGSTHGTGGAGNGGTGSSSNGGSGGGGQGGDPIDTDPRWVVDVFLEETLGPFDSWANAVSVYGAIGDGNTDDTAALQAGLDDISSGEIQVLYLPKGTYKITQTLHVAGGLTSGPTGFGPGGSGVIGEDPATTTLEWAGASGGTMLLQDGGTGYRYARLTWDGSGTAGIGFAEWWDDSVETFYGGSDEHQDEVFRDMKIGIMGGRMGANYGNLDSEGQIRRVRFVNNSYAGLDTGSFNALDWWVWDSSFENCARGVTNLYSVGDGGEEIGAGAMYVYRSSFSGSTIADVDLGNNGWFSLHDNVSVGSKLFIQTAAIGDNPSPLIAQNNRVVGSTSPTPITFGSAGALMLVDNQIESSGPPFSIVNFKDDTDVLALGNTFTAEVPSAKGQERIRAIDNQVVAAGTIATTPLELPATPSVAHHAVFEVPGNASAADIQAIVDTASSSDDAFPIVHFGKGWWNLDQTITIPAGSRIQFVGDGWQSHFNWVDASSSGPMIHVTGPSRFSIRDMRLLANQYSAVGIAVDHADQMGGRIQIVGSENGPIQATHLEHTQLSLQANPYVGITTFDNVKHAVSMGAGPFDVLTLKNGSSFLMSDSWYEGPASIGSYFNIADGTFTYLGGHFAPASHGGTQTVTPLLVDQSKATASWIGMQLDLGNIPSGIGIAVTNEQPETKAYFFAISNKAVAPDGDYFSRPGSGGEVSFVLNRHHLSQYADAGDTSDDAVRAAWAQARSLPFATKPYVVPDGATDVTIYRIDMPQTGGLVIQGD